MRTRFAVLAGSALLATGVGFVAAAAWSTDPSAADQRPAASTPQKMPAASMVVYKSPT